MKAENLISWSTLSEYYTGRNDIIRQNRIPKNKKEEIERLITLIDAWVKGEKLYTKKEIRSKISDIDLNELIL